jgi:hypothetical protein
LVRRSRHHHHHRPRLAPMEILMASLDTPIITVMKYLR